MSRSVGGLGQLWHLPLVVVIALGIGMTGCTQLGRFGIGTTAIGEITRDPGQYKTVMVKGKVSNQFSIFGAGLYQVDDGTGTIWVTTQAGVPSMGSQVVVRGQVNLGINIGGQNFGVTMVEESRQVF